VSPGIYYPYVHDMPRGNLDDIFVAEVLGTSSEVRSNNRFGPIQNASITLSGYLQREIASLNTLIARENEDADGTVPYQYYIDQKHVCGSIDSPDLYLLLLSYRVKYCSMKCFSTRAKEMIHLQGIVLVRDRERIDTFKRVGFFQHLWKQKTDKLSGKFPPFIDFDPKSFVRSVITLI
jgi:hypothetical protein